MQDGGNKKETMLISIQFKDSTTVFLNFLLISVIQEPIN